MRSVVVFCGLVCFVGLSSAGRADDKKDDKKKVDPTDPIQPKAVFTGTREFTEGPPKGKKNEVELKIKSRDGDKFTGTVTYAKAHVFDVKGTLKDGDVKWAETKRAGTSFPMDVKGILKDNKLTLSFKGTNTNTGNLLAGDMTLELEEKK
jgi:hypothetical protein